MTCVFCHVRWGFFKTPPFPPNYSGPWSAVRAYFPLRCVFFCTTAARSLFSAHSATIADCHQYSCRRCVALMQVVWEADTAAFASRKRAARACTKCRAAKKRCHHTFQRPPEQQADSDGLDRVLPNLTHKEPIRFVGDLNPESILTDLSSRSKGAARISRVGTWVEQSRDPSHGGLPSEDLGPALRSCNKTPINVEKYGKFEGGRRVLTGHQRNYSTLR